MAQYTKNPEVVEAARWNKSGDHDDISSLRVSADRGKEICNACGQPWSDHGMRDLGGLYDVICPGTWIITRESGRIEYLDDTKFKKRYSEIKS